MTGSWGTTETAPAVTSANFPFTDARCIGAPLPGALVKMAPAEDAYEIRVQGPNVTPGYYGRPDLTAEAFDAEGFYRTGDSVAFADPGDPNAGLVFRGRIAEDFKLGTGTFVRVGAVRAALLSALPALSDAVIAGEDRDYVSALAWLNPAEVRKLLGRDAAPADGDLVTDPDLLRLLADALGVYNASRGSAARVERLLVLARPASLDAGEITDKGYLNQRRVLAERAALGCPALPGPGSAGVTAPGQEVRRSARGGRAPRPRPAAGAPPPPGGGQHVGDPQRQHALVHQAGQLGDPVALVQVLADEDQVHGDVPLRLAVLGRTRVRADGEQLAAVADRGR